MLGITIRFGANQNSLTTPQGDTFDLSNKEMRQLASDSVCEFLGNNGWFKKGKKS